MAVKSGTTTQALSSPMLIIHKYLLENQYSYDDRRRAMSLLNSHRDVAHDFVDDILSQRTHKDSLNDYLDRIFNS